MAYVVHPHVEFRPAAVNHSPSPLGFGFGLAASSAWQPQGLVSCGQQQSLVSQHSSPHKLAQKRRHEDADDDRDESMDRSPTPERRPMRRILPKRSRLLLDPAHEQGANGNNNDKENRTPNNDSGDGVDVGMLLGMLCFSPLSSHLLKNDPSFSQPATAIATPNIKLSSHHDACSEANDPLVDSAAHFVNRCKRVEPSREAITRRASVLSPFRSTLHFNLVWIWCSA